MFKSRTVWALLSLACIFYACKNDPPFDQSTQAAIDDDLIVKFLASSGVTMTKTSDGLYYKILSEPDTGKSITNKTDTVTIHYVGRFLDGTLFDSTANAIDTIGTKFVLEDGIPGWVEGIPMIKTGGHIRLIVPSALAYQNRIIRRFGIDTLGPNKIFDFDIRLFKVRQKVVK